VSKLESDLKDLLVEIDLNKSFSKSQIHQTVSYPRSRRDANSPSHSVSQFDKTVWGSVARRTTLFSNPISPAVFSNPITPVRSSEHYPLIFSN